MIVNTTGFGLGLYEETVNWKAVQFLKAVMKILLSLGGQIKGYLVNMKTGI